jgi:hypothetical protein
MQTITQVCGVEVLNKKNIKDMEIAEAWVAKIRHVLDQGEGSAALCEVVRAIQLDTLSWGLGIIHKPQNIEENIIEIENRIKQLAKE